MKQRIISIIFILCMLLMLPVMTYANEANAQTAAQTLYNLGLFRGIGDNADGSPNFDLNRTPNRAEAVTMLVRLLGKETEALAGTWETPFIDMPDWAKPYIGYAYNNGLTNGTGADTFSSNAPVSATQYLTFLLRALGYQDDVDFQWDAAWEKTDEIGITNGEYNKDHNTVNRGDMTVVSVDTMKIPLKDEENTLIEKLVKNGAVDADAAASEGYDVEEVEVTPDSGITIEPGANGLIIKVSNQDSLTEAVNQSEKVAEINIIKSFTVTEDSGISFEGEKLENYANVVVTVQKNVTLRIAESGQIGVYWFTYEGNWINGTIPDGKFINDGTLIVEKDGWVNGEFTENNGTVLVRNGGQCQTMPNHNYGTVTVEAGGSFRTTQGQEAVNEGMITVAEDANMVSRFGSTVHNKGSLTVDGLLSIGCVTWIQEIDEGIEVREAMWFTNSGTLNGSGTVRIYDSANDEDIAEGHFLRTDLNAMKARMQGLLGSNTGLTLVTGVGTGV